MLSSSSDGSRERTNSSGTDQERSPPTSLDNNNSSIHSDNNNVIMGSPSSSSSLTIVESSSSSSTSQYAFARPLPVIRSTSSSSSSASFSRSNSTGGVVILGGGSPHTQFEMDSLSPGIGLPRQHLPLGGGTSNASNVHHRLTLSNLGGGGLGDGGGDVGGVGGHFASMGLVKTADVAKSIPIADVSVNRSIDEEAPYLDMSMTSVSGSSPQSLIISQPQEVSPRAVLCLEGVMQ